MSLIPLRKMELEYEDLQKIIRNEVSSLKEGNLREPIELQRRVLREDFTRSEKQELSRIIRTELARIFYDLFKKRNFWT